MTSPDCSFSRRRGLGVRLDVLGTSPIPSPRIAPSPRRCARSSVHRPKSRARCYRPGVERLFRILNAIVSKAPWAVVTARTLAEELEVSGKTVARDLEFLRDRLCVPINYDEARFTWHVPADAKWPEWCKPLSATNGGVR